MEGMIGSQGTDREEAGDAAAASSLGAPSGGPAAEMSGWIAHVAAIGGATLSDADLVSGIDRLERVKAACAAAQARLTAQFVKTQAAEAERLEQVAQDCQDHGDFDGWVAARDRARSLQLPPQTSPQVQGRLAEVGSQSPTGSGADGYAATRSERRRRAAMTARTGVSAQVGLARRESPARGARMARAAVTLVEDLPHTLTALTAGHLNERRAELVVKGTSHLTAELRSLVDAEVIGANLPADSDPPGSGLAGWGDREVERRIKACADRLDPEAAIERARAAAKDRRVSSRPMPDCMAVISAVLPVEMAVAVFAALLQAAATAKAAGDPRSRNQVMADTLYERVTGKVTAEDVDVEVQVVITDRALFAGDDTPAHVPGYGTVPAGWVRDLATRDLTTTRDLTPTAPEQDVGAASRPPASASGPPGAAATADTTGQPTAGLGISDPSTADLGIADPSTADLGISDPPTADHATAFRPPQDAGARRARLWLRRLFTHPGTGTLVAMDSTRRLFPAGLRRYLVARDGVCRTPWCDAPIRHADHVQRHSAGGPTTDTNGQGLCVACNLTKDLPGWHSRVVDAGPTAGSAQPHTVQLTTPTGHRYVSAAPPVLPGLRENAATPTVVVDLVHGSRLEREFSLQLTAA